MRLIDLWCRWDLQYAPESVQYDPARHAEIPGRLGQLDGYLSGTAAVVLACGGDAAEWSSRGEPWAGLGDLLARHEAEFSGRLLIGPEDVARWEAEPPDGIAWGVLGLAGCEGLLRSPEDLDRLPALFARGVRVFQLGGEPGASGHALLGRLAGLAPEAGAPGPRPVVDVSGMDHEATAGVLDWLGRDEARGRLLLVRSHGGDDWPAEIIERFRALGGVIGLTPGAGSIESAESLSNAIAALAAVPFEGRPGFEGIGIGADLLTRDGLPTELAAVGPLVESLRRTLGDEPAALVARDNARRLLTRAAGVP